MKNSIVDGQTLRDFWSVLNDPGIRVHVHAIHTARLDLLQCPARHACTLVNDHQLHTKTICGPTHSLTHLINEPRSQKPSQGTQVKWRITSEGSSLLVNYGHEMPGAT